MLPESLLRPDNRQLALGTGDVSTFGAQPDAAISYLGPASPATPLPAGEGDSSGTTSRSVEQDNGHASTSLSDVDAQAAAPTSPPSPAPARPEADAAPEQPATVADDAALAPMAGGGGTPPSFLAGPNPATGADGSEVGSSAAPVSDMAGGNSFSLASQLSGAETVLSPVLAQLAGVDNALGTAGGRLDSLVNDLSNAVERPASVIADATETLGNVVDAAGAQVAELPGAIASEPVHDIDSLIFSGTNPDAGIGTLVDLVQTSELFTVGQGETPAIAPDASGSIVDQLIDGDVDAVPLGDDTPLDTHIDDGDLGLGL